MYLKIHRNGEYEIVALCDEDLIGKIFEEGKLIINVTESFYKGEKINEEEAVEALKNAGYIYVVGKESVQLCIKLGLVEDKNILRIKGVPHAQIISA